MRGWSPRNATKPPITSRGVSWALDHRLNMLLQRVDSKLDPAVQVVDNSVARRTVGSPVARRSSVRDPFADGLRLINIEEEIGVNTVGIEAKILRSLPFAALVEKADSGEDYGEIGHAGLSRLEDT